MKILLYGINYAPELTGIGKYSGEMAVALAKAGHEVRVVTAPPYYPAWSIGEGYSAWRYHHARHDGVDVWRAPLWVPSRPGGLSRIIHLMTFALSSLPLMARQLDWKPDVVMSVAPAFVCAPVGWLAAKFSGAKSWLHIQDYEVDVAVNIGLIRGRLASWAAWRLERLVLRRFDRISSISGNMLKRAGEKGVAAERLRLLPNWVDVDAVNATAAGGRYRAELNIDDDSVVALFSGSLGAKQGLMVIAEAARRLAATSSKVVFVICGQGIMRQPLEAACDGLPNVRFLPLQPAERLGELLGMADMHLLPQSELVEDLVMPSKLCGMLASGRPIVATCRPDTEIARAVANCGFIVPPGNDAAFSDAVAELAALPQQRAGYGRNARAYAEAHLAGRTILQRLSQDLEALVGRRSSDRIELPGLYCAPSATDADRALAVPTADALDVSALPEAGRLAAVSGAVAWETNAVM